MILNAKFCARATDEYTDTIDNRIRRRFNFEPTNPFCNCTDCIWLSDGDLPYVANGWPVLQEIMAKVPLPNEDVVHIR
jgi:hypothetical protein